MRTYKIMVLVVTGMPMGELEAFLASLCGLSEKFELLIPWLVGAQTFGLSGAEGEGTIALRVQVPKHEACTPNQY